MQGGSVFVNSKPGGGETTETVLEKLKNAPVENVVVRIDSARYLIPTAAIKMLAWNAIPDMIKDENSEAARKHATLRTGLKALIRPFLPEVLKQTWQTEVTITPRLNILSWLPSYLIHFLVNIVAAKEWCIHVERCESCGESVYKVTGISPYASDESTRRFLASPASGADSQSVQGRGESDPHRAPDCDLSRGSVGGSGGEAERKEHLEQAAPSTLAERLPRHEDVHTGQLE